MTDPTKSPEDGAVTPQDAYVSLLTRAGHFGDDGPPSPPGWRPTPTSVALRALTEAPKDEIPNSVRLAVLYDLAREDFPDRDSAQDEYRSLASSVADGRDVDPDELLNDLYESSRKQAPFHTTATGQALDPHEVGFIGESVCTVQTVKVGDLTGTWIYSEFDTDAPFESVVQWVDPRNWPRLAPFMFKGMEVVGAPRPLAIAGQGTDHWHGVFHEEVQLFNRISALLHCDHWQDGDRAAGMTFELDFSPDGQLDVDRGFITVTNIGLENGDRVCRVQALKIVGFTEDIWDRFAERVCPWWTDFLRGAVRGSSSAPKPTEPASPPASLGPEDLIGAWTSFFGTSARVYLDLFEDVNARAVSGAYSPSDWLADGSRFWSRLAKDWVQAWTYGLEKLPEFTRDAGGPGVDLRPPTTTPTTPATPAGPAATPTSGARQATTSPASAPRSPAAAAPGLDDLVLSVPGLGEGERPVTSDLTSIEARPGTIAARDVSVTVVDLPDGTRGVRLRTSSGTSAPLPGLYVGKLLRTAGGPTLAPVQLYISGAQRP
jgi:hypothetical protein